MNPIGFGDSICDHNNFKVQLYIQSLDFQMDKINRCWDPDGYEHLWEEGHYATEQRCK